MAITLTSISSPAATTPPERATTPPDDTFAALLALFAVPLPVAAPVPPASVAGAPETSGASVDPGAPPPAPATGPGEDVSPPPTQAMNDHGAVDERVAMDTSGDEAPPAPAPDPAADLIHLLAAGEPEPRPASHPGGTPPAGEEAAIADRATATAKWSHPAAAVGPPDDPAVDLVSHPRQQPPPPLFPGRAAVAAAVVTAAGGGAEPPPDSSLPPTPSPPAGAAAPPAAACTDAASTTHAAAVTMPLVSPEPTPLRGRRAEEATPSGALAAAAPVAAHPDAPATPAVATAAVAPNRVAAEVADHIRQSGPGRHRLEITLHPPELGRVEVHLVVSSHAVHATFVAQSEAGRDALAHHLPALHDQLAAQGFTDTQVGVDLAGHGHDPRPRWQPVGAADRAPAVDDPTTVAPHRPPTPKRLLDRLA